MDTKGHPSKRKYIYGFSKNDLNQEIKKKMKDLKPSLFKEEQKAMGEFAKRNDIITTNVNKGGAVVIMYVEKNINETNRQQSDKRNYKTLQEDPTLQQSKLVHNRIIMFKKENLRSKIIANELKSVNPDTQNSKFHSKYIKNFEKFDRMLKDKNDIINKTNNFPDPPNSILVTTDDKSLCTSIPNIKVIKENYTILEGIKKTKNRRHSKKT